MQDVDQILSTLRDLTGIDSLHFDADGQASLSFEGGLRVTIAKLNEEDVELNVELDHLGTDFSPSVLTKILELNFFGDATGAGRLSLDPRDGTLCYGRSVHAADVDALRLQNIVLDVVRRASYLSSGEVKLMLSRSRSDEREEAPESGYMIRV